MKDINEQITNLISMTWMNSPKATAFKKIFDTILEY